MNFIILDRTDLVTQDVYICKDVTFVRTDEEAGWTPVFLCHDIHGLSVTFDMSILLQHEDAIVTFVTENTEGFEMMFISNPGCKEIDVAARLSKDLDDADTLHIVTRNIEIEEIMKDLAELDTTGKIRINPTEEKKDEC